MAHENNLKHIAQESDDEMPYQNFQENAYTKAVWDSLLSFLGNEKGVAGMMGNLYHESHCYPNMLNGDTAPPTVNSIDYTTRVDSHEMTRATFISSRAYGLAQWLSKGRKANLYDAPWGGGQPSAGNSIGSLSRGLAMIQYELNSSSYASTKTALQTATDINAATEFVFVYYEGAGDSTLGQRQYYAQQIYNTYAQGGTGDCYVALTVIGNGTATVVPQYVTAGNDVTLTCTPASGEQLLNIEAREVATGYAIAVSVTTGSQLIPINADAYIIVTFSGDSPTPPVPPTPTQPTKTPDKHMPIWMYPFMKC